MTDRGCTSKQNEWGAYEREGAEKKNKGKEERKKGKERGGGGLLPFSLFFLSFFFLFLFASFFPQKRGMGGHVLFLFKARNSKKTFFAQKKLPDAKGGSQTGN
jgi:hypothetical protein